MSEEIGVGVPIPPKYVKVHGKMIRNKDYDSYRKDLCSSLSSVSLSLSIPASDDKKKNSDANNAPPKYIKVNGHMIRNRKYDSYLKGLSGSCSLDRSSAKLSSPVMSSLSGPRPKLKSMTDLINLSNDFELASDERTLRNNPGAKWVRSTYEKMRAVRSVTVIEKGRIVADYKADGVDHDATFNLFSTTKAVISMLIGVVIHQTDLSLNDTLGDIFKDEPHAWSSLSEHLEERSYKKSIRLEEILTMTSGLKSMIGGRNGVLTMEKVTVPDAAGSDLPRALAAPDYDPAIRGSFHYMPSSNILSYVIKSKTGKSPREFADTFVFPKLGIKHSKMSWDNNADGIETSFSQLRLTTHQMCKIGQLYLQDGFHDPNSFKPLLPQEWIEASHSKHVFAAANFQHWYGYLWGLYDKDYHENHQVSDVWVAPGFNGQLIAVCKETDRVCAISRLPIPPITGEALIDYKKITIKLLSKTITYHSSQNDGKDTNQTKGMPHTYIKDTQGKMIRNPEYDQFMADLKQEEDKSSRDNAFEDPQS